MSFKNFNKPGVMLELVLKSLFKKPVTTRYPFTPAVLPEKFRGEIAFDPAKCIGCQICVKDCPSDAIKIIKVGDKRFKAEFNLGKCIYCAQCVDSCPKKALSSTLKFELAQVHQDDLKITYEALPEGTAGTNEPKSEEPADTKT